VLLQLVNGCGPERVACRKKDVVLVLESMGDACDSGGLARPVESHEEDEAGVVGCGGDFDRWSVKNVGDGVFERLLDVLVSLGAGDALTD